MRWTESFASDFAAPVAMPSRKAASTFDLSLEVLGSLANTIAVADKATAAPADRAINLRVGREADTVKSPPSRCVTKYRQPPMVRQSRNSRLPGYLIHPLICPHGLVADTAKLIVAKGLSDANIERQCNRSLTDLPWGLRIVSGARFAHLGMGKGTGNEGDPASRADRAERRFSDCDALVFDGTGRPRVIWGW